MDRNILLEKIAPCSLMCHTCGAYEKGVICTLSNDLLEYMYGVYEYYEEHCPSALTRFQIFQEELGKYGRGKCQGCRGGEHHGCSIKDCFIYECVKQHDADFCGECTEFPCSKTKKIFEQEIYGQWLKGNGEIKAFGINAFWEKNKDKPHYEHYIKNI